MSQAVKLESSFIPVREALKSRGPYHAKFRYMRATIDRGPDKTNVVFPAGTYSLRDERTREVDLDLVSHIGINVVEEDGKEKVLLIVAQDKIGESGPEPEITKTDLTNGHISLVPGGVIFKLEDDHTIELRTHEREVEGESVRSTSIQELKR